MIVVTLHRYLHELDLLTESCISCLVD